MTPTEAIDAYTYDDWEAAPRIHVPDNQLIVISDSLGVPVTRIERKEIDGIWHVRERVENRYIRFGDYHHPDYDKYGRHYGEFKILKAAFNELAPFLRGMVRREGEQL